MYRAANDKDRKHRETVREVGFCLPQRHRHRAERQPVCLICYCPADCATSTPCGRPAERQGWAGFRIRACDKYDFLAAIGKERPQSATMNITGMKDRLYPFSPRSPLLLGLHRELAPKREHGQVI